jgi:tetratricopeptide (TPR) repeat protein
MTRDESTWLVKSSGRILGPFPSAKIAELIRSREISVLDEISPPNRRWQTIQYHEQFREVVDSMRKASLSERTEATWTPTGATSITQTLTDLSDSELTDEMQDDGFLSSSTKEIVIHNVQEHDRIQQPVSASSRFQTTAGQNTAIQRQVEKTTRGLWIVTSLILLAVAAFIAHKRFGGTNGAYEVRPTAAGLKQNVIALVQIGHYAEALKEMKSFFSDPAQAGDLAIYYGSLLIQVEGQTVLGRRLLNQVLTSRRPETKQAYTGLGVADLVDGQLDSAQENFQKALSYDAGYVPALVDMSAVYLQKGDYGRAKQIAAKALQASPMQGEALLSIAEAQLYLFKVNNNGRDLETVNKALKEFIAKSWDFKAELGFYSLYFDFLRNDRNIEEKLHQYLDRDPQLTADHRHNVFIYRGRSQWKVLSRFCEQMADRLSESPRVATFMASCYAHEGRWDNARRNIEKAVNQSPRDPLVQAWSSYISKESGEPEQASVILGRATEYNRRGEYVLPALLQARFCQSNGDVECARDSWQKIYERNLEHLPAVAGLAWVHGQKKSYVEALKLVDKGLRISPDYIPLLELRQRAEREGWYAAN